MGVDCMFDEDLFRDDGTDGEVCLIVLVFVEHFIGPFQEIVE